MKKLVIVLFLSSVSSAFASFEVLHFATDASYAPFEFIGSDNQIQGFDIDLANALCRQMQTICTFSNQAFDSLIPSLCFRRFDAIISGMDITQERLKQVIFTYPYYKNSAMFIAYKDRFRDLLSLAGKRVGTQNGSSHQKYLMDQHHEMITISYDSYQNAILDLKNGRLDSAFGDTAVLKEWLMKDDSLTIVANIITDNEYFGTGFGIAVRQNNSALVKKFNQALVKIKQDGTYQGIYRKWLEQ